MKVKSYMSPVAWLAQQIQNAGDQAGLQQEPDPAAEEISRILSDVIRSKNLIVLAGLGTSLCVKEGGISKAPTMSVLWTAVKDEYQNGNDGTRPSWEEVMAIARQPQQNENIEELLSRCKTAEDFEGEGANRSKIAQFISDAERIIREKVDFLARDDDLPLHQTFLRRLARRSTRRERLKIFTTNYDLCFEHAAQRSGFVVIDGFSMTQPSMFQPLNFGYDIVRRSDSNDAPDYIESLFHLYKVHGSINWELNTKSQQIIKKDKPDKPLLIYPRNTKYEQAFSQPYLEMISSFQTSLRARDSALLIIGFGFNDNHLAEPILSAIETNLSLKVAVISPGLETQSTTNPHLKKIAGLIERGDARLALIATSFEEVIPMIPDIAALTDLERHLGRVKAVRGL